MKKVRVGSIVFLSGDAGDDKGIALLGEQVAVCNVCLHIDIAFEGDPSQRLLGHGQSPSLELDKPRNAFDLLKASFVKLSWL